MKTLYRSLPLSLALALGLGCAGDDVTRENEVIEPAAWIATRSVARSQNPYAGLGTNTTESWQLLQRRCAWMISNLVREVTSASG